MCVRLTKLKYFILVELDIPNSNLFVLLKYIRRRILVNLKALNCLAQYTITCKCLHYFYSILLSLSKI